MVTRSWSHTHGHSFNSTFALPRPLTRTISGKRGSAGSSAAVTAQPAPLAPGAAAAPEPTLAARPEGPFIFCTGKVGEGLGDVRAPKTSLSVPTSLSDHTGTSPSPSPQLLRQDSDPQTACLSIGGITLRPQAMEPHIPPRLYPPVPSPQQQHSAPPAACSSAASRCGRRRHTAASVQREWQTCIQYIG